MAFYIDTIEQTKGEENTINEYGKREKWNLPYEEVLAKFFKKLSDVSNDIDTSETGVEGKNHYFMDIRIVNSLGGVVKKDVIGKYKE